MKKIMILAMSLCLLSTPTLCQGVEESDFRLSLTIEPLNFFANGYSFWVGLKYKKVEVGITTFSAYTNKNVLFENDKKLDIRLSNGTAFYTRFYPLNSRSGPFIGFLIGKESWRIRGLDEPIQENILKNSFLTLQSGYQWTPLDGRLIVNPNIRIILPFAENGPSETQGIPHGLKSVGIIPALDVGIGIFKNP